MSERAFLPPRDPKFYLLRAHRQPLPENVAAAFIDEFTRPGELVLDPFVASDAVVRVALARGRRVIAADSNPLVSWVARVEAMMPPARDINAAFLRLGDTRKEGDTLRATVGKLYASTCADCGGTVSLDYILHRRAGDKDFIAEKIYTCATCGFKRTDATEADRQRAASAAPRGLHYHVLVQRLLAEDAANAALVKRLLGLYTPRNLNALALVTQKLDADFREDAARNILAALLLHALDVGTSLYSAPDAQPTREIPNEFVEVNIWRAMETVVRGLSERGGAIRLASTPLQVASSATPAAFIGTGGARSLADALGGNATPPAALVLSSPARLDPLFWELSFLWTRWLLGKNAAVPLQPLLDDKNQRWGWYGEALTNAFAEAAKITQPGGHCVVAFPSGSHAMIEALVLAASPVFALQDFVFRPHRGANEATEWGALRGDYQAVWRREGERAPAPENPVPLAAASITRLRADSLQAAREILDTRGEPLAYSWLHHAALARLARQGVLPEMLDARYKPTDNAFQFLRHRMEEGFKEGYIEDFDHWEEKGRVLWLRRGRQAQELEALSERVEAAAREALSERERIGQEAFEQEMLRRFPGLLTPEIELVELAARAYADLGGEEWEWRERDVATWNERVREKIAQLGELLRFQTVPDPTGRYDVLWRVEKIIPGSASGHVREERIVEDAYGWLVRERIDVLELGVKRTTPLHGLVVIPETQVEWMRERVRRDPRIEKQVERAGWAFVRESVMDAFLQLGSATMPEFTHAWGLAPPAEQQEQMELFEVEG